MALTIYPLIGFPSQRTQFTFSGQNWDSGSPVTNLQNLEYARVARSTGTGAGSPDGTPVVIGTSPDQHTVGAFYLAAHNLTLATGTYQLEFYEDEAMTDLLYDSGPQRAWPSVYGYAGRYWHTPNFWTGQYTEDEIAGQIPGFPIILDQNYAIRAFRLTLTDNSNPAGYIQAGLLEVATAFQPCRGIRTGAQDGYVSYTQSSVLQGGLRRHDVFPPSYTFQGEIPFLPQEEAENFAYELFRQHDVHTPFLFVPHPTRELTYLRMAKMVTQLQPGLFTRMEAMHTSIPFNVEEYKG